MIYYHHLTCGVSFGGVPSDDLGVEGSSEEGEEERVVGVEEGGVRERVEEEEASRMERNR